MGVPFRGDDSLIFQVFNRGKRSVALDLKTASGIDALHRLAENADILVHNLRPGAVDALGLGGAAMCARHARLIYCELSAFGHIGPDRLRPGYEPLLQAYSGLSSINGGPGDPPIRMGASLCDQGTGMVGRHWRPGLAAAAPRHGTRWHRQRVAAGDGAELGRFEDRCAAEPGSAARTPSLRPS